MRFTATRGNDRTERAIALLSALAMMMALMVFFAPAALAHHPTITAHQTCVDGEVEIAYTSTSWKTDGSPGSAHDDVRVEVSVMGGAWTEVDSGAYESPNYSFSGTFTGDFWGKEIRVRSQVVGNWDNGGSPGNTNPESTTSSFLVSEDCFNPSCEDGLDELKVEPVSAGTFGDFTISNIHDAGSGPVFDWSSSVPVVQVIVKGGPGANLYDYGPAAFADSGLHAPVNPNNGSYYGLSHITFCSDDTPPEPEPGNIVVVKEVTEGSDTSHSFDFTASYDDDGFSLADGDSNNSGDLDAGTYSVAETVPDGWTLESATCDDQSPVSEISLQAGETVTCTFTNDEIPPETEPEPGQIIVVKQVTDGSDTSQSFDFTASYDDDGFSLVDGGSDNSGDLDAGIYSVSESDLEGWTLESATCSDGSSVDEIDLAAGETVTCTFINDEIADEIPPEVLASIVVTVSSGCDDGTHGVITVGTSVPGGATVVITDSDGQVVGTFTEDGSVTVPDDATYTWVATPSEGFEFPPGSMSSGTVAIEDCIEVLPFTGIDTEPLVALASLLAAFGLAALWIAGPKEEN